MGDVLSLIDTVTENIDEDEVMGMAEKMASGKYNYNDLLKQFKMIKRMGSISKILGFLPGMKQVKEAAKNIDDRQLDYVECIIKSMTEEERRHPELIDQSATRRKRIAMGSGRSVMEVNRLRESLEQQKKLMKKMNSMSQTDMQKMANDFKNGNMPVQGMSRGKGKGKGDFRIR
jgi:signal recognition particle subunit SRP54